MKKKSIFIVIGILVILLLIVSSVLIVNHNKKQLEQERAELTETIKSHYNLYVKTNKETDLYKKETDNYIKSGKINKDVNILLSEINIDYNTKYFHIKDLDLYIKYEDVGKTDEFIKDDRFKNYIYFNKNITTKSSTSFYDIENNYLYTLNESYDFSVLVIDEDRYGIVFNDELLFVKKDDVEKIYDSNNTDLKNKTRIRTLTYHLLYDPATYNCDQIICHTLTQFESHLKYIKENNYFSLTLEDLELYLDGKIQIPEKSIVLTIDDGTILDDGALRLLEEYDVVATLFLITGWVSPDRFNSTHLNIESHTHNMHNQYECPGYGSQGGGILCLDEEYVLNDLKLSQDNLGGSKYFAYPFYDFNDRAIKLLQKAGFTMAFIGQYDSDGYSYPNKTNKYLVRRKAIFSSTTLEDFVSYLK